MHSDNATEPCADPGVQPGLGQLVERGTAAGRRVDLPRMMGRRRVTIGRFRRWSLRAFKAQSALRRTAARIMAWSALLCAEAVATSIRSNARSSVPNIFAPSLAMGESVIKC